MCEWLLVPSALLLLPASVAAASAANCTAAVVMRMK
jgi:hypothetical protein